MSAASPLGKIQEGLLNSLRYMTVAHGYACDLNVLTGSVTEDELIQRAPAASLECHASGQELSLDKSARVTTTWNVYGALKNSANSDPVVLGLDFADDLASALMHDFQQGRAATLTTINSSVLGYVDEQRSIVAVMLEIQTINHIRYE